MASPSAKYSKSANRITSASASATHAVEPHNTIPTTKGISIAAVATRFQVMNRNPPNTPQGRLTAASEKLKGKERQKAAFGGRRTSLPAAGGPPLFQSNPRSNVQKFARG